MALRKVVIAGACRTAIGKFGGTLKDIPAADLGTVVIKEALRRSGVKPEQVDDLAAVKLARAIADKIEDELKYPGEIKVNVLRELRAVEYAR